MILLSFDTEEFDVPREHGVDYPLDEAMKVSVYGTNRILDCLLRNDVKATFFVVGRGDEYYDTYRDIVGRGHTLALHSYTHDYDKIYASLDDFAEDIEELRNLLYDVTGVNCVYYRFPGGSSNTVSKVDMDTLIDYVESQGPVSYTHLTLPTIA